MIRPSDSPERPSRSSRARLRATEVRATAILIATALLGGCDTGPSVSLGPFHVLTGAVRLEGRLFEVDGTPAGTRAIADADSVRVYLATTRGIVDSARTLDGRFRFLVTDGTYFAFAGPAPGAVDSTAPLRVRAADAVFPDTVRVISTGAILPTPNPFSFSLHMLYSVAANGPVRLEVRLPSGRIARVLIDAAQVAGLHAVLWDGRDLDGTPVAPGAYWVVLDRDGTRDAELVFRDP